MDPIEALRLLLSPDTDLLTRLEAAEGLRNWLSSGGFVPATWEAWTSREKLEKLCEAVLRTLDNIDEEE